MLYRVSVLLPIVLAALSPSQDVHSSPQDSQSQGAYVQAYVWNGYGWVCVAHQFHPMESQQYEFSGSQYQIPETTQTDAQTEFTSPTQDVQAAGFYLHEENYPQQYGFVPYNYDPQMQQWFAPETPQTALDDMNVPSESGTTRVAEDGFSTMLAEMGSFPVNFRDDISEGATEPVSKVGWRRSRRKRATLLKVTLGAALRSEETRSFAVNHILQNMLPHLADNSLASRLVQLILGGDVRHCKSPRKKDRLKQISDGALFGEKTFEFPKPSWEEIQHVLTYFTERKCVMRFAKSPSGNFVLARLLYYVFEKFTEENDTSHLHDVMHAIASQIPNLYDLALHRFGYKLAIRIVMFAWGSQSLVDRVKRELLNPSVVQTWQKARGESALLSHKERQKMYFAGYYLCLKAVLTVSNGQALARLTRTRGGTEVISEALFCRGTEKERQLAATTLRDVFGPDIMIAPHESILRNALRIDGTLEF